MDIVGRGEAITEMISEEWNIYGIYSVRRRGKIAIAILENKGFSSRKGNERTIMVY